MPETTPHLAHKEVRPLFVTPLMRREYDHVDEMNRGLAELLLQLEKSDNNNAPNTTNVGGFHTGVGFLDRKEPPVIALKQLVSEAVIDFAKEFIRSNCSSDPTGLNIRVWGWGIVMRAGDSNFQHVHPDAKISGVYYVSIPNEGVIAPDADPQGSLIFVDPRPRAHMNRLPNQMTELVFDPISGTMVVFPSYFEHGVAPFRGEGHRICVAFNAQLFEPPPNRGRG